MTYNRQIEAQKTNPKRTHLTAPASHPEWNEGSQCAKQTQIVPSNHEKTKRSQIAPTCHSRDLSRRSTAKTEGGNPDFSLDSNAKQTQIPAFSPQKQGCRKKQTQNINRVAPSSASLWVLFTKRTQILSCKFPNSNVLYTNKGNNDLKDLLN
jgi:hypothetical protein